MAKRTKKLSKSSLRLEALEQRQLLAGVVGGGTEVTPGGAGVDKFIVHPTNGNHYDQVLMTGETVSVTNDAGTVTRVSFLDAEGDIVQAEFAGAGKLTVSLAGATADVAPEKYLQTGVKYMQGTATFTIEGSDASTHFQVFSVGGGNALTPGLFDGEHKGGNNTADVARITVVADPANPNGSTMGSIRAGNAVFSADSGVVGISAANVQVQNLVIVSDINAKGTAIPTLVFGANSQFGAVTVAGGGLISDNGEAINNVGSYQFGVKFTDGTKSDGSVDAKESSSPLWKGVDATKPTTKSYDLTTAIDAISGTAGADTVTGVIGGAAGSNTLNALDEINGGAGNDTLRINDVAAAGGTALPGGIKVIDVENIHLASAGAANIDTTGLSGVTNVTVLQGTTSSVTAGGSTGITIAGVTSNVVAEGGSTVAVTAAGGTIDIGGTTAPKGAVTVNQANQGANTIAIDGGTDVTVTTSKVDVAAVPTGTLTIGGATAPTGVVTVNSAGEAYATTMVAGDKMGAIAVTGGSSISVTQTAPASGEAAKDTSNVVITQGAVSVTGSDVTTAVTVTQDAAVGAKNYIAAAGAKEVVVVTFKDMTAGQTVIIDGLTFTAAKDLKAAEVAAAFASIGKGGVQGTAAASVGLYTGSLAAFGAGAAAGDKVTFTADAMATASALDVDNGTAAAVPTIAVTTEGVDKVDGQAGVMGVAGGMVTIADGNSGSDSIATVSLTGYGAGTTIASDALTSLTLAKSNADVVITNGAATTLGLAVNAVGVSGTHAVVDDASAKYTTINITATGADSFVALDAIAAKTLTVAGEKSVTLTAETLDALETVTVSGSAGLTLDGDVADTLKAIDTSATTGSVTATIDPTKATYTGGAGADNVTITGTATKAINLGAGDDSLTVQASTTTSELVGGDGTDTVVMSVANAASATVTAAFETKLTGFEKLSLLAGAADAAIDLDNLDEISFVTSVGTAGGTTLSLDNVANNGTLEVTATNAGTIDVDLKDATGTTDTFNVVLKNAGDINAGTIDIAGVESINLTATDSKTSDAVNTQTVKLVANELKTLTVTGSAKVSLDSSSLSKLTLLDGSAMTATLTATGNGSVAEEIRGGSGADTLTAGYQGDILIGNAGNDTLVAAGKSLVTLTGGAGSDTFDVKTATTNVNSYATITDLAAGDKIQFAVSADAFVAGKVTLDAGTAVFQDYANQAIAQSDTGDVMWFQYNGNTYIIENVSDHASAFVNNTDVIVKISGLVDLSKSSFSTDADTLLIV